MKIKKYLLIAYLIIGTFTVIEFIFIQGMFTWLISVITAIIIGALNIIISLRYKEWLQSFLFLLATVALCMGYFVVLL